VKTDLCLGLEKQLALSWKPIRRLTALSELNDLVGHFFLLLVLILS
jgi:hypothetical protein